MNSALGRLIKLEHDDNSLRAWSLIITLFGDAIVPRGGMVSSQTVQQVMHHLNFEPGAVRTALSRLCKDGWVERDMQGRHSFYRLASIGVQPFAAASLRIYARPNSPSHSEPAIVSLAIGNREKADTALMQSFNAFEIRNNIWCWQHATEQQLEELGKRGYLTLTGSTSEFPSWLISRLKLDDLANDYQKLLSRFQPLARQLPTEGLDALACRCLLVHNWRRLLLRTPTLSSIVFPKNWPQPECHQFTAELYHALLKPSSKWLDEQASGPEGALPADDSSVSQRFR